MLRGAQGNVTNCSNLPKPFSPCHFFSSHLFPTESPSVLLAPAQSKSRRLAANACWAACVRTADQHGRKEASALRRMFGTAPRACTVWNGEILGMRAPWIIVGPETPLLRIGQHVFGTGWMKSKEIPRWCRPRVALPRTMCVPWL